jgi:phasin
MSKDAIPPFGVPSDMRALAEQSVEQAKVAFNTFIGAAQDAVTRIEGQAKVAQAGARDVGGKAMTYAEHNVAAAFDFAQKVVRANSPQELLRLQTEYVQAQIKALTEQAKDLGETAARSVMGSSNPKA